MGVRCHLDLLETGLGGPVHASKPQGLDAFRCPPSLLQTMGLQVEPWEGEGGVGVRIHGLGQGERLVFPLQHPLHKGGRVGKVLQPVGLSELRPLYLGGPGGKQELRMVRGALVPLL